MSSFMFRSFRLNIRGVLLLIICGCISCLLIYNRYSPYATTSAFNHEGTSNVTGMIDLSTGRPLTFQRDYLNQRKKKTTVHLSNHSHLYVDKNRFQDAIETEGQGKSSGISENMSRKVKQVNCAAIFDGDENETVLEERLASTDNRYFFQPNDYMNMTSNCSKFILERGYVIDPLDELEKEFPIAFSILMYTAIEQAERLLRAIYRPQNVYCFHIDSKSGIDLYHAMSRIAECFDNVHVLEKRLDVQWGYMSVLKPEILCMEYLWNHSAKWKYFINLTGMEFPLKTNYELVRILQAYNGSNDIAGTIKRANKDRWANSGPPPQGIVPTKGGVQIIASRGFVDFALHDPRAAELLNWTQGTGRTRTHPDETFFSTLNHNPFLGVPGSYRGIPETDDVVKPFLARYVNWYWDKLKCHGKYVRSVCIYGARDLPPMKDTKKLFVNKFHQEFHPLAYDCLEELLFNRTRDRQLGLSSFNFTFYSNLDFVKNRVQR